MRIKCLFIAIWIVPFISNAAGLQVSFSGANLEGLTRSTTMLEYDASVTPANYLIDKSGRGHNLSPVSDPGGYSIALQKEDGRKCIARYFDGSADYYTTSAHADFNIFDNDFTLTVVLSGSSSGADTDGFFSHSDGTDGISVKVNSSGYITADFYPTAIATVTGPSVSVRTDSPHVVQLVRSNNYSFIVVDGLYGDSSSVADKGTDVATALYLGTAGGTVFQGAILYTRLDAEALTLDRLNYERSKILGTGLRSATAYTDFEFSRTTMATQTFSDGSMGQVSMNVARTGGDGGGVRVEGQVENYALQSQTFGTTWTRAALTTVTSNGMAAPDGTVTADGLVGTASDTQHGVTQDITETAATWTHSIYAKPGNNDWLKIEDTYGAIIVDWQEKATGAVTKPSGRQMTASAYDSARGVVVVFGGYDPGLDDETWEWNGTTWTQKASGAVTKPSARASHAMAYDSSRGVVVLFGGGASLGNSDETWEWNGSVWVQKAIGGVTKPSARAAHAMAFDANRNVTVLFGGISNDETWEWNGSVWVQKASGAVTKPSARYQHAMAFDSVRGVVVLFGGIDSAVDDETWEWDGSVWVQRAAGAVTKPSARRAHGMAFDSNRNVTVLFGGYTTIIFGETWEWDGATWTKTNPIHSPEYTAFHAMSFDSNRDATVLFGGYTTVNSDRTWEYTSSGGVTSNYAYYNINKGYIGATSGSPATKIESAGNGFYRASMTVTGTAEAHTIKYYSASANNDDTFAGDASTNNVWLWGAQSELGYFATSYIPTTTSSVTKTQDYLTIQPYKIGKGLQLGGETMWIDFSQDSNGSTITTNSGGYTLTRSGTVVRRNAFTKGEYYHVFNGTDSKWSVVSGDFNPVGNFSVVAVFTPNTVTGNHVIASKYTATDDQRGWYLMQGDSSISIARSTDGLVGTLRSATVSNCLAVGKPSLVTASYSTTGGLWIKVDAFTASADAGATGTVHPSTYDFVIGDHGTGAKFNGNMNYLSFFDYGVGGTVLSEAQHDSLYTRFKQTNILPPKLGNSYLTKQLTIEFEAKCPYSSASDIGAKRTLVGITNYLSPVVTNTKNSIEVYHGSDGRSYGELYDSTGGTQRYIRSAVMTTLNQWHKYKFYIDFLSLTNSTFTIDTTAASDKSNMSGSQDVNVLDSLIRIGQTYNVGMTGYVSNSFCAVKNLRIQPNRF